jgi:uncharacterized membrane protein YkoI
MSRRLFFAAALAVFVGLAGPAAADPPFTNRYMEREAPRDREEAAPSRPVHELLPIVRRQLGGAFIGMIGEESRGGRVVYILRWRFEDERVADVRVDGWTGQVLGR